MANMAYTYTHLWSTKWSYKRRTGRSWLTIKNSFLHRHWLYATTITTNRPDHCTSLVTADIRISLILSVSRADWSFYCILVPLFMCHRRLVVNMHVDGCILFILRWHQTPFVRHFISLFWNNITFNASKNNTSVR